MSVETEEEHRTDQGSYVKGPQRDLTDRETQDFDYFCELNFRKIKTQICIEVTPAENSALKMLVRA